MTKLGMWYQIRWKDGASANTRGDSEEDVKSKAHKYHKGEIKSITCIEGASKPPWKKEERYPDEGESI